MKKFLALSLCLSFILLPFLVSCGSSGGDSDEIPDLNGEWKQSNSHSDDSYQAALISDGTIEIHWVTESTSTKSLYWAGTYDAPTTGGTYSWDSKNDTAKTSTALLASGDDTKTFKYSDGKLSYSVSFMGTTQTVELEKVN